jgi:hypothetical protein
MVILWVAGVTALSAWQVVKGMTEGRIWTSSKTKLFGEWVNRAVNPKKFRLTIITYGVVACMGAASIGTLIATGRVNSIAGPSDHQ